MARSGWSSSGRGGGRGLVVPILLIIVGAVLLLNNLGVLSWSVWGTFAQLWPVILVLVGVELVLGRRTPLLGIVVAAIVIAIAIGVAGRSSTALGQVVAGVNHPVANGTHPAATAGSASHQEVPLGDTQSARATLNFGAGDLRVGALPTDDAALVKADAILPNGVQLVKKSSSSPSGETDLTLATEGRGGFVWPFANRGQHGESLVVNLARKVPLNLQTNLGAGQADLDLRNLSIQTLDLNSGAGQTTVHFPSDTGQIRANIRSGAGELILIVPPTTGAYLHTTDGLVSVHLPPGRYTPVADGYQSDNYASTVNQIDIYLQLGVGQVDVQ